MNKTELISAVAEQSGLTKKDAEKAVTAVIEWHFRNSSLQLR